MASTITALTSGGGLAMSGDTSGVLELKTDNGTYTATVPQATGTVMVSGNMPAFSAYNNATQSITLNTATKVTFNTEDFDTNNNFASSRFTPTVAGYYLLTVQIRNDSGVSNTNWVTFYKNGAEYIRATEQGSNYVPQFQSSLLLYLNGTTDYVEVYYTSATNATIGNAQYFVANRFTGVLVRGA